ncbi:MAG: hypothetical protein Kow00108_08540 [Calditrichia bacterium]
MNNPISRKIVITRSLEQSKDLIQILGKEHIPYIIAPVIKIIPLPLTDQLKKILHQIDTYDMVLFTSSNAVRYFFYFLLNQFIPQKKYAKIRYACLGEKTKKTLESYGYKAEFIGKTTTGDRFISDFLEHYQKLNRLNIFIPVSKLADQSKFNRLKIKDWEIETVPIYNTVRNQSLPESIIQQIKEEKDIVLTFFSPSAVRFFLEIIPVTHFNPNWTIAAIGDTTRNALEQKNIPVHVVPEKSTSEELVKAIKKYFS